MGETDEHWTSAAPNVPPGTRIQELQAKNKRLRERVRRLEREAEEEAAYVRDWREQWEHEQVVRDARRLKVARLQGRVYRLRRRLDECKRELKEAETDGCV